MALHRKGILGGFSGKVGTVVGSIHGDRWIMSSLPARRRKKNKSTGQARVQSLFKFLTARLRPFLPAIRLGYQGLPSGVSGYNAAMKHHFDMLFASDMLTNQWMLSPQKIAVTNGLASFPISISPGRDYAFALSWTEPRPDSVFYGGKVCFFAINNLNGQTVIFTADASAGTVALRAGSIAEGTDDDNFHVYAFAYVNGCSSAASYLEV